MPSTGPIGTSASRSTSARPATTSRRCARAGAGWTPSRKPSWGRSPGCACCTCNATSARTAWCWPAAGRTSRASTSPAPPSTRPGTWRRNLACPPASCRPLCTRCRLRCPIPVRSTWSSRLGAPSPGCLTSTFGPTPSPTPCGPAAPCISPTPTRWLTCSTTWRAGTRTGGPAGSCPTSMARPWSWTTRPTTPTRRRGWRTRARSTGCTRCPASWARCKAPGCAWTGCTSIRA